MSEDNIHKTTQPDPSLTIVDKLRMLLDITKKISQSLDLEEVISQVMDTLEFLLPYDAAGIYVIQHDEEGYIFKSRAIRGYRITFEQVEPRLKLGEGFIGYVAQTGESILCPDVHKDKRYFPARKRTNSEMVAPIVANDEVIGVFDLESDKFDRYTIDDLSILQMLAAQLAIIIEKVRLHEQLVEKKRLQTQVEIARQVQLALLPERDPKLKGFDISSYNFSTDEVSGDYYDWVTIFDDQIGVVIADASGKGIPASLLMSFLRASLRALAQIGYAPNIALSKVNNLVWDSVEGNQFITAIYGFLDGTNKTFVFTNAGHNPPIVIKETGEIKFIEYGDLPLGMFKDKRYHQHFLRLGRNDILVLYTDGLTEASNENGEEFGKQRLAEKILEGRNLSSGKLINFVYQAALDFSGKNSLDDDGTVMIIKRLDE
jgi:sigma-B regulation protein RsbU (phosphoserine phosphatase)